MYQKTGIVISLRSLAPEKLESLGYRIYGVVCVILHLVAFVEFRLRDRQTDRTETRRQRIPR